MHGRAPELAGFCKSRLLRGAGPCRSRWRWPEPSGEWNGRTTLGEEVEGCGRERRVRSWPVHTIQFRVGANQRNGLGWCRTSLAESMHAVYPTREPENVAGCQAGLFQMRFVIGQGPHAAMSPCNGCFQDQSIPGMDGCAGGAPSVGSSLPQRERVPLPFSVNHGLMSGKVRLAPWLPMHTSSTEQLRRSGCDGRCREPGSRTGQPLEPCRALGERQVAVKIGRSMGRQSTAGQLASPFR